MTMILTSLGDMDESLLIRTVGVEDRENCIVRFEEWRLASDPAGDPVKRNVAVEIKKGHEIFGALGSLK